MQTCAFPVIDPVATGRNILNLRLARGLSVRDIQRFFNLNEPRAIYKWQKGQTLPSVDNLYALSALFRVTMDQIIVGVIPPMAAEPQVQSCGSAHLCAFHSPFRKTAQPPRPNLRDYRSHTSARPAGRRRRAAGRPPARR